MKVIGSVIMYCGLPDPSTEFDQDTAKEIVEKLYYLQERCDNIPNYKLGFRGYSVIWDPEAEGVPWVRVQAHDGVVEMSCFGVHSAFKDTIGLEAYLKEKMEPVLQEHFNVGQKAIKDFMDQFDSKKDEKELDKYDETLLRSTD